MKDRSLQENHPFRHAVQETVAQSRQDYWLQDGSLGEMCIDSVQKSQKCLGSQKHTTDIWKGKHSKSDNKEPVSTWPRAPVLATFTVQIQNALSMMSHTHDTHQWQYNSNQTVQWKDSTIENKQHILRFCLSHLKEYEYPWLGTHCLGS